MANDTSHKVLTWVSTARAAAVESDRPDLAERLGRSLARLQRPRTVVCVVGEFKQGKSSLINALLGGKACPVDDDLATAAVTVVHDAPKPSVSVRMRGDTPGAPVVQAIAPAELADYVTEAGNPDNARGVERVDIGLPHPLLQSGLTLVDTPGMGGVGSGVAALTLAFVPFADALLFVTDASAELSAPELALLQHVRELCPVVRVVLTKIDLYPEWRRIHELDRRHLENAGLDLEVVPVSSSMRLAGAARNDEVLIAESGVAGLVELLQRDAQGRVKNEIARVALADADDVLAQLESMYAAELAVLEDPSAAEAALRDLQDANARVDQLRAAGSRWSTVLGDRMSDVANRVGHGFRSAVRDINRRCDERVEALESSDDWEALARDLQSWVAEAVTDLVTSIDEGVESTRSEIAALLADEGSAMMPATAGRVLSIDPAGLWRAKDAPTAGVGQRVMGGLSVVRGAQGGVMMLGMMGRFLPGAAATVLLSNPVTIGLGVLFAGHAVIEQRKKKITAQRQQAKQNVRQFLDDVQFEVGNELNELVRTAQRDVRDEFSARIAELQRSVTDAVTRAKEHAQASDHERTARVAELRNRLAVLDRVRSQERPA